VHVIYKSSIKGQTIKENLARMLICHVINSYYSFSHGFAAQV